MTALIEDIKHLVGRYSASLPEAPGDPARSAVIVPLHEEDGRLWITCIKRSKNIGLHRDQMGFPGGMAEPADGGDLLRTALRESKEEIGLEAKDVDIAGVLSTRSTIRSGLTVKPFVGIIPWPYRFIPDPREVQSIHTTDLRIMACGVMEDSNPFGLIPPVYPVDREPVWGLTARIVKELLEVIEPVIGNQV